MKLIPIQDPIQIKAYLTKDNLYKNILGLEEYPIRIPGDVLICEKNNSIIGVLILQLLANSNVCFHGGIYKEFRGSTSVQSLKQAVKKLKRTFYPLHICTMIPESNKQAIKLVEAAKLKYKRIVRQNNINYKLYVE